MASFRSSARLGARCGLSGDWGLDDAYVPDVRERHVLNDQQDRSAAESVDCGLRGDRRCDSLLRMT